MRFDLDIAILGGGASGLMAALAAAQASPQARVAILEKQTRVGKKLLATGNGRCNLLNAHISPDKYHGDTDLLVPILRQLPPDRILDIFRGIGVEPKLEYGGRIYPMSGQAASVLDDLRLALAECGVREICETTVTALRPLSDGVEIRLGRDIMTARRAVACFGSAASPHLGGCDIGLRLLAECGHAALPFLPALTGIKTDPVLIRALKGVRLEAVVSLLRGDTVLAQEAGDVIFSEYGLSGTAPMALSRRITPLRDRTEGFSIGLNALPGLDAREALFRRQSLFPRRAAGDFLTGLVHKKLGQTLLRLAAPDFPFAVPCGELRGDMLARLAALLTDWRLPLRGVAGLEQAQVAAGGVRGDQVEMETLASRRMPHLYLAGEALNIDGDCGGYNLYWAWASGFCAGHAAALSL